MANAHFAAVSVSGHVPQPLAHRLPRARTHTHTHNTHTCTHKRAHAKKSTYTNNSMVKPHRHVALFRRTAVTDTTDKQVGLQAGMHKEGRACVRAYLPVFLPCLAT
jgi:hypothetical protein